MVAGLAALPLVKVDPGQMEQVVMNLVQNAADATEHARARRLEISGRIEEGAAVIEFHDSGPGIPAENLDKLFDPFFTTKPKGLGLGLPLARRIVERMNGRLTLRSLPGEGTTVTIELPKV